MSRWFRYYDGALNDPKVQRLPGDLFKAWVNLLCLASQSGGEIRSAADAAFALRLPEQKARVVVAALAGRGLFDAVTEGYFVPHNWNGRQFKSDVSNERVKRFRERECNVTPTVTETPPETEEQIETDSEKKERKNARERASPAFEEFWAKYPNKVGKQAAQKAFKNAVKLEGVTLESLLFALDLYRNKTDDRPWCNPATWLNQHRWNDQPAEVNPNGKLTVHKAAANLLEHIRALDEPAPSDLRNGTSECPVRRLPSG